MARIGSIFKKMWTNKSCTIGAIMILLLVLVAVLENSIAVAGYNDADLTQRYLKPSAEHFFGTDEYGRDVYSRTIYGARLALRSALLGAVIEMAIGVTLGLPFPAGPFLEELAVKGENKNRVPVSFEGDGLRCHLSGAEAQLLRMIETGETKENVAAEVYGVLCRTVLRLVHAAAEASDTKDVLIAGGVASSRLLRDMLAERNEKRRTGLRLYFGRPAFSGDNAVGAALIGLKRCQEHCRG